MPGRGWSRRAPWPYDLRIGGVNGLGCMLKATEDGQLVAIKSKPLDAAPATYQYETQQPFLERTYVLRDLWDGMGQQTQPVGTPRRSYYGIDVDTSINGHVMLGPLFHAETVAAGKSVTQILVALEAGLPAVFALAGNEVRRRTADGTWVSSLTLGGGSEATQAVRFKPAGIDQTRPQIVSPERLPPGSVARAYSYRLAATGGTGPYAWGIASGHLPAGLTLASTTGVISGTPTVVSSTAFELRCLDAGNLLTSQDMALRVESSAQPLGIETPGPQPEAKLGEPYGLQLEGRGGVGPYTWAVTVGSLPTGLTLTAATGVISGTPTAVSADPTPTFTVQVTDAGAATTTAVFSIRVRRPNADYLYLASTGSNLYLYDGSVWDVAEATGGPPEARAERVAVLDNEFWVAWDNKVAKAEANPLERDNYAGAILLEGADATHLATIGEVLYIFKKDGVYTLNKDGTSQNILPQLRAVQIADNGQQASSWLDSLWAPIGNAFYRIQADGTFRPVGTEQLLENASEVRGRLTCSSGHNTWFLYKGLFNPASGASYLMKYGSWVENEDLGEDKAQAVTAYRAAHHGALKKWASKQITTMSLITAADLGTTNDRLYCGFADGSIEWCVLPRYNPNPQADTQSEYAESGSLYFPSHHAGYEADVKNFRAWSVFGPVLSNLLPAQISYRIDPSSGFTTLSDEDGEEVSFTANGQRYDVPGATLVGKTIEFRIELARLPGASVNTSPLVFGVALHEQLRPSFVLEWAATVDASTAVCRHDGTSERRSPEQVREALRVACAAYTPTSIIGPGGIEEEFGFLDYREEALAYNHRYGTSWEIAVRAMQYRTLSNVAQVQGLSYSACEQYDYAGLEQIL